MKTYRVTVEDIIAEVHRSGPTLFRGVPTEIVIIDDEGTPISMNTKIGGRSILHIACLEGDIKIVALLLNQGANPDVRDSQGFTPLMIAGAGGYEDIVDLLLRHNANVNAVRFSRGPQTALTISLGDGHLNTAKQLLKAGADPDIGDSGSTPLAHAVSEGDIELTSLILECGAGVNISNRAGLTPLGLAVRMQDEETIKLLLGHGADPTLVDPMFYRELAFNFFPQLRKIGHSLDSHQAKAVEEALSLHCTPLGFASRLCRVDIVRLLLAHCQPSSRVLNECLIASVVGASLSSEQMEAGKQTIELLLNAGADIHHDNNFTLPPLAIGVRTEDRHFVQWLLDQGASPAMTYAALMQAAYLETDDPTFAEILIEAGANVNARDKGGETSLDCALRCNNVRIADFLREHGAKTEAELIADQPPELASIPVKYVLPPSLEDELFKAISSSHLPAVKAALGKGAKLTAVDDKHHTPLIASVKKGNAQLVKLFLDHKAGTKDVEPKMGMTALMIAAKQAHASISSLLIHAGADIKATDWNGNSVLRHAMEGGNFKIIEMLIDRGADIERKNNKGMGPLEWATKNKKSEMLKLIEERSL